MTHSAPRRYCLYPSNLLWHWCDLDRLRSCDKRDLGPEIQAPNSQDLWFQQVELPPCPILDSSDSQSSLVLLASRQCPNSADLQYKGRTYMSASVSNGAGSGVSAIAVRGLVKRYVKAKVNAVDGVSFDVARGEFFGLLGPNGAGKTT